jgi:hypothetical protein
VNREVLWRMILGWQRRGGLMAGPRFDWVAVCISSKNPFFRLRLLHIAPSFDPSLVYHLSSRKRHSPLLQLLVVRSLLNQIEDLQYQFNPTTYSSKGTYLVSKLGIGQRESFRVGSGHLVYLLALSIGRASLVGSWAFQCRCRLNMRLVERRGTRKLIWDGIKSGFGIN